MSLAIILLPKALVTGGVIVCKSYGKQVNDLFQEMLFLQER